MSCLQSIDSKHMITTGEEGYRADGPTDCCEGNEWLNGGYKVGPSTVHPLIQRRSLMLIRPPRKRLL